MYADKTNKTPTVNLYEKIVQGDESAYYELFELYWEQLYSIAFKILRNQEIAKDIVQDLFLSIWEKRNSKDIQNIESYLTRAAKFSALKEIRDNHFKNVEPIDERLELAESIGHDIELNELQVHIESVIEELPDKCKAVFKLSRNEQLSNKEIAEKLNLSKRTVETHISNALKHLRKKLPKDQLISFLITLFI